MTGQTQPGTSHEKSVPGIYRKSFFAQAHNSTTALDMMEAKRFDSYFPTCGTILLTITANLVFSREQRKNKRILKDTLERLGEGVSRVRSTVIHGSR